VEEHVKLLKTVFDFPAIQALLQRPDFSFVYDSMHGVQGPYAKRVFCEVRGVRASLLARLLALAFGLAARLSIYACTTRPTHQPHDTTPQPNPTQPNPT
jgi:hypothetical protein